MDNTKKSSQLLSNTYIKFLITIVIGLIICLIPPPTGVSITAWYMLAIFIATIFGCILKPFPIGSVAIIGLTVTVLTNTVKLNTALSGFSQSSIWLIVMASFISRGFIKTGLGSRIAYKFVKHFCKKTIAFAIL